MLDVRGRLLLAGLGLAELRDTPADAVLASLHSWLDSWRGIGAVVVGMHAHGYDLALQELPRRMARELRLQRDHALGGARLRVGADPVARRAARGVGGADEARDRRG